MTVTAKIISKVKKKILIIGSVYDKLEKIPKDIFSNYEYVIFNGNLCYPFDGIYDRIELMNNYLESERVIYNLGNLDLQLLNNIQTDSNIRKWIINKPNVIVIYFSQGSSAIVVNGGITKNIKTVKPLNDNLEVSFVNYIDNVSWHNHYTGDVGYVISNNPLTESKPDFFPYSTRMGTKYGCNIYGQEIDNYGLKETLLLC